MPAPHPYIDQILPLDEAACATLGHVRYFTGNDDATTLSAMFAALVKPGINAALWANAGQSLDPVMLGHLHDWRNNNPVGNGEVVRPYPYHDDKFYSGDMAKKCITAQFNAYTGRTRVDSPEETFLALQYLHDHIQSRVASLQQIFPDAALNVELRMENDARAFLPHYDVNKIRVLRLLEPLNSEGTILCNTRDFYFDLETQRFPWIDSVWGNWHQKNDRLPVAYQAPSNSLLIITNSLHHSQPVMHCAPVRVPGRPESFQRELICYDLAIPGDWHKTFKPA